MKISLIVSDLSAGGILRAFVLSKALNKLNYYNEVIGFQFGKELYAVPPTGIVLKSVPIKKDSGFFDSTQKLWRLIDGDILYAVKPKPTNFGISLLKKLKSSRPLLLDMDDWELSWHGGHDYKYRPSPKQLYQDIFSKNGQLRNVNHPLYTQWMEKLIVHADAVTVDTRFLQNLFGGTYLPNITDTELFNPHKYDPEASRKAYGLSGYKILMFSGAVRPHKGIEDVLLALEKLQDENLRVVIVGDNPYDDYDRQIINTWGKWIIKLPKFSLEEMPKVLASAHILLIPQRDTLTATAQLPLKLLDAMSMAKPILSTKVGDIPEVLGGYGYVVAPNSPEEIADKIKWIFDNIEAANAQGIGARERCIKYYSIEAMASQLSQVITKFTNDLRISSFK